MTSDLGAVVADFLQRHALSGCQLTVGYSGGLDSTVLLHVLADLSPSFALRLSALHVHHGLSPNAERWAAHCAQTCDNLGVSLSVVRVQLKNQGSGLEAAARNARYQVFSGLKTNALLLAHHRDDQAETVLLQLMRGATARGMSAMPEMRFLHDGSRRNIPLMRPLLGVSRQQLLAYAEHHGLSWVEDESNLDTRLARNQMRHALMPVLETAWPGFAEGVAHAASQFSEWAAMLDNLAELDAADLPRGQGMPVQTVMALPEPRARNLLRWWLEQHRIKVSRQALIEALRQIATASATAQVRVDFSGMGLTLSQGSLYCVPVHLLTPPAPVSRLWQGEPEIDLGTGGRVRFQPVNSGGVSLKPGQTCLRYRQAGDRLRLRVGQHQRPLKDWLREARIASWKRVWLPCVEVEKQLAWVADLGIAAEFHANPGEQGWFISWEPPW